MLSPEDLAYMRETQAEARPTAAELVRRSQSGTASGGRTDSWADGEPIQIRLDGKESSIPAQVIALVGSAKAVKIVMDLVEVRSGDVIRVSSVEEYQVVTDGDPDQWATAQVVWAKRTVESPR